MEYSFEVKLSATLLEEIFKTLSEKIHDHNMIHLTVLSFLVTHKMEEGHKSLSTELVNELTLPEEHNVALHFDCFFLKDTG